MSRISSAMLEAGYIPGDLRAFKNADGRLRLYDSGGGSSPAPAGPQQTTAYNTNIPEYAKPYVTNMLGATQKQLFDIDEGGGITGFKPYQPYSTDVNNYFAGFSPMQQQAFSNVSNMQTSPQNAQAAGMAGMAGLGAMGAGQNYQNMATNPYAMQAYMSPYQQYVTDFQKQRAIDDYGRQLPGMQAQAVGAGAFGGSRQAIQQAEGQRNLQNQLAGIQATGSQNAFQNAQQAQQFGADLGLKGLSQANQSANTLLGAGQQDYSQQMGINAAQQAAGQQQQTLEQNKINQGIQNYATQQQYPMMQLGMMSNMLRGLPMQSTTTQSYQATPSALTQGIGALGTLGSAYKAFGNAEGGAIKGLAGGGEVAGYSVGGTIRQQLDSMSLDQLRQIKSTSQSQEIRDYAAQRVALLEQAQKSQASEARGLTATDSGSALESGLAGGGIIAFADAGLVPDPTESQVAANAAGAPIAGLAPPPNAVAAGPVPGAPVPPLQELVKQEQDVRTQMGIAGAPQAQRLADLKQRKESLGEQENRDKYLEAMRFFSKMGTTPGSVAVAALTAAEESAPRLQQLAQSQAAVRDKISQNEAEIGQLERAEKLGFIANASAKQNTLIKENADLTKSALEIAGREKVEGMRVAGMIKAAGMRTPESQMKEKHIQSFIADAAKQLGIPVTDPRAQTVGLTNYYQATQGGRTENAAAAQVRKSLGEELKAAQASLFIADEKDKPAIQQRISVLRAELDDMNLPGASQATAPAQPAQNQDGTITVPGKGKFKLNPATGNYQQVG
jgi:hypothetical protein